MTRACNGRRNSTTSMHGAMKRSCFGWLATLTLCGLMGSTVVAAPAAEGGARNRPAVRERVEQAQAQRLERLSKELDLTAEQKPKVEAVLKKQLEKARAMRQELATLTPEQRREKARPLRTETQAEMKKILTAEQYEKYQKMQKNQEQRMRERAAGGARPRRGNKPAGE